MVHAEVDADERRVRALEAGHHAELLGLVRPALVEADELVAVRQADDAEAREPRVVRDLPVAAPAVEAAERRIRFAAEDSQQGQHTGRTRSDPFVHLRALPSSWAAVHRPRTQLYGASKKGGLPRDAMHPIVSLGT
jgi:hypothetical protein